MVHTLSKREVMPLPLLWRTALKSIYEPKKLFLVERGEMEHSIVNWKNHLVVMRDMNGGRMFEVGTIEHQQEMALELIANEIQKDMDGKLERRKELIRKHGLSYEKIYRLPGAVTKADRARGQEALRKHMKTNSEDYQ